MNTEVRRSSRNNSERTDSTDSELNTGKSTKVKTQRRKRDSISSSPNSQEDKDRKKLKMSSPKGDFSILSANKPTKIVNCSVCSNKFDKQSVPVQCSTCDRWVHSKCDPSGLPLTMLEHLKACMSNDDLDAEYNCKGCREALKGFRKGAVVLKRELERVSEKVVENSQRLEEKVEEYDRRFEALERQLRENSKQETKDSETTVEIKQSVVDTVGDNMTRELEERQKRKKHLIVHGIDEADSNIKGKSREDHDVDAIKEMFEAIEAEIVYTELKKIRRIGKYDEGREGSRPLLLIFETVRHRDGVYLKGKSLMKRSDHMKKYRMVPDLTETQRKRDKQAKDDCDTKNALLSGEDKEKFHWKPVGERGQRKAVRVSVRQSENDEADTVERDWKERAKKRNANRD